MIVDCSVGLTGGTNKHSLNVLESHQFKRSYENIAPIKLINLQTNNNLCRIPFIHSDEDVKDAQIYLKKA